VFDVCYECDGKLIAQTGTVFGYWGNTKIEFTGLPRYQCKNCNEIYLDEKIAVLTQEITKAFSDLNEIPEVLDISDCYETLVDHLDDAYDIIKQKKVQVIKVNQNYIINCKDVNSLFNKEKLSMAARNIDQLTPDVKKEIDRLVKQD